MNYYKDEVTGSYYILKKGKLFQYPMNTDGTKDTRGCEVDWDIVRNELPLTLEDGQEVDLYTYLSEIEEKLK